MKRIPLWLHLVGLGVLALLYLPLIAMTVFSFNSAKRGFVWEGFTLKWYAEVFSRPELLSRTGNTLLLAFVSTIIATVLGTLLALGLDRYPWHPKLRSSMDLLSHLPVVTPDLILAAAMIVALQLLQHVSGIFQQGFFAMVLGHVTFQIPFVAMVVRSRLATLGPTFDEAGRDLFAGGLSLTRRVTLPLLAPGIAAGAMLAFTLSLDDFVISYFTASARSETLPLVIYAELRRDPSNLTYALSTLMFAAAVVLVFGLGLLTNRSKE